MSTRLQKQFKGALLGGLLASLFCAHGVVGAVTGEDEPTNSDPRTPQLLAIPASGGEVSVSATMDNAVVGSTAHLDIFAFDLAGEGTVAIKVITDGTPPGDFNCDSLWDPFVALYKYDPDPAASVWADWLEFSDDAWPMVSDCGMDAGIVEYVLNPGRYLIAVTMNPRVLFEDNFRDANSSLTGSGGPYTLALSVQCSADGCGTASDPGAAMEVPIRILHWDHAVEHGLGKFKGKHAMPVAILSAPGLDFDAVRDVDQTSLTFGATGDENTLLRCKKKGKDVKTFDEASGKKVKDGFKDLVCYFRPDLTDLQVGDGKATLKGKTMDGKEFKGDTPLPVFEWPEKKEKSWLERHNIDPRGKRRVK